MRGSCCCAEQQPAGQQPASLQHRVVAAPVQHAVPAPQPVARRRRQRQGFLQELLHIPVMLVNAGAQIIYNIFNLGFTLTTSVGSRVLPQSIQRNLQGARLLATCNILMVVLDTIPDNINVPADNMLWHVTWNSLSKQDVARFCWLTEK